MPFVQTILLALTGIIFAIWTYLMFRTLMDQRHRAVMRTGQPFPSLRDALIEWRHWLTSSDRARNRWQLLIATLGLFVLIALNALLARTDTIPT
ncbi:MAG: hypothetical protein ACSHWS_01080 [Sulfitobacter sp.]